MTGKPKKVWVKVSDLKRGPVVSKLTEAQKERILAFHERLGDTYPCPPEQAFDSFSRDLHPESEIQLWERITDVWEQECNDRPGVDKKLVLQAVLTCSFSAKVKDMLTSCPGLEELGELQRIVDRFLEAIEKDCGFRDEGRN